jgi:hypothetical protein
MNPPSITCPKCGRTSYNAEDIANGYCGHCHEFTGTGSVPRGKCPTCGYSLEAVTMIGGDQKSPRVGDFSVCFGCGEILVFKKNLSLRLAELNDLAALPKVESELLTNAQSAIREYHRKATPGAWSFPKYEPPTTGFPPKTLDDVMAWAEHYANHFMRLTGEVRPAFFFIAGDGEPGMFLYEGGNFDASEKDAFSEQARIVFLSVAAKACVFISETWTIRRPLKTDEMPRDALDREEGVTIFGEAREGHLIKAKTLRTIRTDNGKFFGFGESEPTTVNPSEGDTLTGRFTHMLSERVPPPHIQDMAKIVLQLKDSDPFKVAFRRPGA